MEGQSLQQKDKERRKKRKLKNTEIEKLISAHTQAQALVEKKACCHVANAFVSMGPYPG